MFFAQRKIRGSFGAGMHRPPCTLFRTPPESKPKLTQLDGDRDAIVGLLRLFTKLLRPVMPLRDIGRSWMLKTLIKRNEHDADVLAVAPRSIPEQTQLIDARWIEDTTDFDKAKTVFAKR
jgi:hypothetical protein